MLYSAESNASLSLKQSSALLKYVRASHPISVNNAYYCSGCSMPAGGLLSGLASQHAQMSGLELFAKLALQLSSP